MIRPRELSRSHTLFPAKTPTLPPATHTNSYALGARAVLLVEPATPYGHERAEWIAWARGLPSQGRTPVAVVVTHHHIDHVGGAAVLARELGLPVWAHEETAARLTDVPVARHLRDGEDLTLDEGEQWRVLPPPGHAPGHICLWEEATRTLVVGDMVASTGTILIAPGDGDMAEYLTQLERLAELPAAIALPAHGDPIDTPQALLRQYVAHRLAREQKVLGALAGHGPAGSSIEAIVPIAYDDTPAHVWPLAQLSAEAHLEKLVREGRVVRRDGVYARMR